MSGDLGLLPELDDAAASRPSGVYPSGTTVTRSAVLSDDGAYRYLLGRTWEPVPHSTAYFVMLNPSTANADRDDPTIRRCVGFARAMGCGALAVVNLYALRATNPADLWLADREPIGADNDQHLLDLAVTAEVLDEPLIAAWGANARPARVAAVCALPGMHRLKTLGTTKYGAPRHPLYLPATARPAPWTNPDQRIR